MTATFKLPLRVVPLGHDESEIWDATGRYLGRTAPGVDASAIVRAVNAHDGLVRAAKALLHSEVSISLGAADDEGNSIVEWPEWDALAAAVAEVEGEG